MDSPSRICRRVSLVVATCALLAACGRTRPLVAAAPDGPTAPSTTVPVATAAPSSSSPAIDADLPSPMEMVVLRLDDLPTGWTQGPPVSIPANVARPCDLKASLTANRVAPPAAAQFEQAETETFVFSGAVRMRDEEAARKVTTDFTKMVARCRSFTQPGSDGTVVTLHLAPLIFPTVGDATAAAVMTSRTSLGTATFDLIVSSSGDGVAVMEVGGLGPSPDADLAVMLQKKVLARF